MSSPPFSQFEKFFMSLIDRTIDDYVNEVLTPLIHFAEKDSKWLLEIDLPMVNKDDIDITLADNNIVVTAKLEKTYCISRRDCMTEFNYFKKVVPLPTGIDKEKISAKFNNGILSIHMPKIATGKKIQIE
ncbi:MAG TPA: Hsp20/alpha crystallin family protein [Nitrosopumilaceae archaeon]|nr:Hsp20/alpha crystallin family protein [Nitrosopumilaceae archaeon]